MKTYEANVIECAGRMQLGEIVEVEPTADLDGWEDVSYLYRGAVDLGPLWTDSPDSGVTYLRERATGAVVARWTE